MISNDFFFSKGAEPKGTIEQGFEKPRLRLRSADGKYGTSLYQPGHNAPVGVPTNRNLVLAEDTNHGLLNVEIPEG